jgi:nitroreductase
VDLLEAVLTRRSGNRLTDPAPELGELLELVRAAATAPDHGGLRPWRLVLVAGDAREKLGEAFAATAEDRDGADRARLKALRAPLLVSVLFQPCQHPKIPEWEQLAAAVSLVQYLQLLLHGAGWGSIWRTGEVIAQPAVHELLGVGSAERLLGWLYVGTPHPQARVAPRARFDVEEKVTTLGAG